MAVDEARRASLFRSVADLVGEEDAVTLFELLPPPSTDLATTADIARLEERFETVDAKMDALRAELTAVFRSEIQAAVTTQTRALAAMTATMTATMVASVATLAVVLG